MARSKHPAIPARPRHPPNSRILVPVRYAAWLSGDLGRSLERTLQRALEPVGPVKVTRLPRAFLIEAPEAPGPLLEAVQRAAMELEQGAAAAYPVFHHEMGPVWTGTLQSVFQPTVRRPAWPAPETVLQEGEAL